MNSFGKRRTWLLAKLAGMERGGAARRAFAARYAEFCAARLQWEKVEGATAYRLLRLAGVGKIGVPSLLVCGAASSDTSKFSGCGFSLELLVEEKFGFFPAPAGPRRVVADRPALPAAAGKALKGAGKFTAIVVSQVLCSIAGPARARLLKDLLAAAGFGARLFIIDSGLGYPEFGPDWELTGNWLDCAPETLETELRTAGWRLLRTIPFGKWRIFCAERA